VGEFEIPEHVWEKLLYMPVPEIPKYLYVEAVVSDVAGLAWFGIAAP
jgi:hypothetical protein